MTRHMIGTYRPGELRVAQDSHDLEEVHLALVRKNFLEIVEPAANVAHMDLVDFSSFAQVANNGQDLAVWVFQPLSGRSKTQLKSIVWTLNDRFVSFDCFKDRWRIPI